MQLAGRLAATLLALTWITPVAQAATVPWDFTLIDGTDQRKAQPEMARVYTADLIKLWVDEFGDLPSRTPAEISKAIIDQAHAHKLRAIEGTSFIIKSNSIYRGNNVEQSPQ